MKVPTKNSNAQFAVKKSPRKNAMIMRGCVGSAGATA